MSVTISGDGVITGTVDVAGIPAFDAVTTITATNASWPVPSLGDPIVKVTVIGGGGGAGAAVNDVGGATGGSSAFGSGEAWEVSASGGYGAAGYVSQRTGAQPAAGAVSDNGGRGGNNNEYTGNAGGGGEITVGYVDLTGISTVNVVVGAGGAGGDAAVGDGGNGNRGEVIVEYRAA